MLILFFFFFRSIWFTLYANFLCYDYFYFTIKNRIPGDLSHFTYRNSFLWQPSGSQGAQYYLGKSKHFWIYWYCANNYPSEYNLSWYLFYRFNEIQDPSYQYKVDSGHFLVSFQTIKYRNTFFIFPCHFFLIFRVDFLLILFFSPSTLCEIRSLFPFDLLSTSRATVQTRYLSFKFI